MSVENSVRPQVLSTSVRLALVAAAVGAAGLIATAQSLEPSSRGFGTHEQLGLTPCWIYSQFEVVCPSCGMTTAWAHASRGALVRAAACNAGGLMLWCLALAATPWSIAAVALGRWPWFAPTLDRLLWTGSAVLAVTLLDWLRRVLTA